MTAASPTSRTSRYTLMSRALRPRHQRVSGGDDVESAPPPAIHRAEGAFGALVAETVADAAAQLAPLAPAAHHHAGARREPFHPIRMQQVRHAPHAEPTPLETGENAPAGDLLHFRAHALQVVLAHRLGDVLERGAERLLPGKGIEIGRAHV